PPTTHLYTLSLHDALPICKLTLTIRYPADIPLALRRIRETAGWLNIREESGHLTMSLPPYVVRRLRVSDSERAAMNMKARLSGRSEEHTSELQSRENLVCR